MIGRIDKVIVRRNDAKEIQTNHMAIQKTTPTATPEPVEEGVIPLTPVPVQTPASTVQSKPLTIDHPMGQAPVPPESEHVLHPRPVVVPEHILSADDDDLIQHLVTDGEGIVAELTGSAMHATLQNLTSHFRHVLVEARSRFLPAPDDDKSQVASLLGLVALALASLFWIPTSAYSQVVSQVPQQNNAAVATVTSAYAGTITNSSGLNVSVSPGSVYCNGATSLIHNTQFSLTANTGPWNIFYRCSGDIVAASLDNPGSAGDIMLGTVTCGATTCATIVDLRSAFRFPNMSDLVIPFGPGDCAWNATGTLGATTGLNLQAIGASFAPVNSISTTAAGASTDNLTCNIHVPQRTTASKGVQLLDCVIYYGVQTTALTSLGAPTLNTITMPAPGTAETASTVTPVSLGAVTVTPVVGSANLGTTTAGAFFSEKISLTTPVFLNTDLQEIQYNQTFVQSAAAAQIVNTPGGVCHAVTVPL